MGDSSSAAKPHAILLCAGLGSRRLPFIADRPECLIEIGGRTICEHPVSALWHAGVGAITVVGGYRIDRLDRRPAAIDRAFQERPRYETARRAARAVLAASR